VNINDLLTDLAACLCVQIERDNALKPCFCGVLPGSAVAQDFLPGCLSDEDYDGMAWVRLAAAYPANQPGIPVEDPALMDRAGIGIDVEMGIIRSIPVPEDGIDEVQAATAVTTQITDMQIIRRAVQCCMTLGRGDYLLTQYTPVGPMGGAVGGAWTLMVHKVS
jgi:hypothetical protein